jgi:hypothetical protein
MTISFDSSGSSGGGLSQTDQEKLDLWTVDPVNNVIGTTYSVKSGLNSFKLGDMHTTHSGGENVFDQNNISGINWFPVWQGVKPLVAAGTAMTINPTSRQYTKPFELLTNGAASTANNVAYDLDVTLASNESALRLEVVAGEAYTGKLAYKIKNQNNMGAVKYTQFEDVSVAIGDPVIFDFTHPSESRSGDVIRVQITKDNGAFFLTKSGLDNVTPWLKVVLMGYEDVEVSAGVKLITANQDVLYSTVYAVDTTSGAVTLTPDISTGLSSFSVFDAMKSFSVSNPCIVDFGTLTYPVGFIKDGVNVGGQLVGTATLQTKNDNYMFYWDGQVWRTLDQNTKDGGIA